MNYTLERNWSDKLSSRFTQEYKKELFSWLEKEYATKTIFPPKEKVFNALNLVPVNNVKVVRIGLDGWGYSGDYLGRGKYFLPYTIKTIPYKTLSRNI